MLDEFAHIASESQPTRFEYRFDRWLAVRSRFLVMDVFLLQDVGVDVIPHHVMALHVDSQGAGKAELSEPEEANLHGCTLLRIVARSTSAQSPPNSQRSRHKGLGHAMAERR